MGMNQTGPSADGVTFGQSDIFTSGYSMKNKFSIEYR